MGFPPRRRSCLNTHTQRERERENIPVVLSLFKAPCHALHMGAERRLREEFEVYNVTTPGELRQVRRRGVVFAHLVVADVHEREALPPLLELAAAARGTRCLLLGRVPQELAAPLVRAGFEELLPPDDTEGLLEKLRALQLRATFRVDWSEFGVDLERCGYWTRKFLGWLVDDNNFLKYRRVGQAANELGISSTTLHHNLNGDCWLSPKQILMCLQNYHAAYFLSVTTWSPRTIAKQCGFTDETMFCKSFKKTTGLTPREFRLRCDWNEYPDLFVEIHGRK